MVMIVVIMMIVMMMVMVMVVMLTRVQGLQTALEQFVNGFVGMFFGYHIGPFAHTKQFLNGAGPDAPGKDNFHIFQRMTGKINHRTVQHIMQGLFFIHLHGFQTRNPVFGNFVNLEKQGLSGMSGNTVTGFSGCYGHFYFAFAHSNSIFLMDQR